MPHNSDIWGSPDWLEDGKERTDDDKDKDVKFIQSMITFSADLGAEKKKPDFQLKSFIEVTIHCCYYYTQQKQYCFILSRKKWMNYRKGDEKGIIFSYLRYIV